MTDQLELVIRAATPEDLPALEWEGEYRRFRKLYQLAMEEAKQGRRTLLVAAIDGRIVGQIFIQFTPPEGGTSGVPTGYIYSFRVRPEVRNQGIGTRLIEEAEAILRRQGCQRAMIAVAQQNHGARRLYERHGYSFWADDPGSWSFIDDEGQRQVIHEPAHILMKALSDPT
jgi:ribosomal protein S18 acetylase RimI-like enzyme